tara:strand:- start:1143 stop:1544 length:402 start_codon:yes stop_codon:yes gene_type:complete
MIKPNAKDACLKICEAIWSCRDDEQKKGCYTMRDNYIRDYGEESLGVIFIELELKRLEKMIEKMKERQMQMQRTQEALKNKEPNPDIDPTKADPTKNTDASPSAGFDSKKHKLVMDKELGKSKVVPINAKEKK